MVRGVNGVNGINDDGTAQTVQIIEFGCYKNAFSSYVIYCCNTSQ